MAKKPRTTRLLIADDDPGFRAGLRSSLENHSDFEVVGEAGDGQEAVRQVRRLQPDVLLLNLALPRLPGLEVLRKLARSSSSCRIVVLRVG